ncbi:myogenesis-regulating glycosidase-like isoform X2 [Paramacrobiotus metropolitanus]|uniref:myogenesis-regulating glycosidase-like isoform X2 n=1 Tax=Paramacrobiotus metropolitanus TaxID=2943436 RepID=UPI0024462A24|nr:myogenesis-regulating glycosidase-like isoform X2 [Paramacrobiotus metropolitanus]
MHLQEPRQASTFSACTPRNQPEKIQMTSRKWTTTYKESEKEQFQRKKRIAYAITGIVVVVCAGVLSGMIIWFVLRDPPPSLTQLPLSVPSGNASLHIPTKGPITLTLPLPGKSYRQNVVMGSVLGDNSELLQCENTPASWSCYQFTSDQRRYSLSFKSEDFGNDTSLQCTSAAWSTPSLDGELTDCIDLGSSHWFGGGLLFAQHWPMQLQKPMTPFVSGDILQVPTDYGGVLEPYWVSTDGVGVIVDYNAKDQPLHTSWNASGNDRLCFSSRLANSLYKHAGQRELRLNYKVCTAKNVVELHKGILKYVKPWSKPAGIPSRNLFEKPIWSTWVSYKTNVSQNNVMDFITDIVRRNFTASNIEIDDGYQEKYGDFTFNAAKFSNVSQVVEFSHRKGFKVTVWVYPFVNADSASFSEGYDNKYFVMSPNSSRNIPAMTSWWQGKLASLVDFTNQKASNWYFNKLNDFRHKYNFESFKFDGGEANWMPFCRTFDEDAVSPDYYGRIYAQQAAERIGNGLEVRVGLHNQQLPIFVRMLDKDSVVGYDNGLKTLIPTALTFGLLGYPFVLPDMIGGNAYRNLSQGNNQMQGLLESQYPNDRLYLRWLGATVFMPSLQFSITPWYYESRSKYDPTEISKRLLQLREPYTELFVRLANEAVTTGYPIIRPLWWINGDDATSWTVDDQFLVGDDLMVAPIVDDEFDYRTIYVPPGEWQDVLLQRNITGPLTLNPYTANLDQVPIFKRWPK